MNKRTNFSHSAFRFLTCHYLFIALKANPVEYGHIFMVPCNLYHPPNATDKKSLEFVLRFSSEVKNNTFYAFYDHPSSSSDLYFQVK